MSLHNVDTEAAAAGIKEIGQPYERISGADYAALVGGKSFPVGNTALLDSLDVMASKGMKPDEIRLWLRKEHGIEITVDQANAITTAHVYLPKDMADFVKAQTRGSLRSMFGKAGPLLDVYDNLTALFKGLVTVLWPRFHTRNLIGGHVQNVMVHGDAYTPRAIAAAGQLAPGLARQTGAAASELAGATLNKMGAASWGNQMKTIAIGLRGDDLSRKVALGPYDYSVSDWSKIDADYGISTTRAASSDLEFQAESALRTQTLTGEARSFLERLQRVAARSKTEGPVTPVWDEFLEKLHAHAKVEWQDIKQGRLRGPVGQTATSMAAGMAIGGGAMALGGGAPAVAAGMAAGTLAGLLQSMTARSLTRLGGEVAQMGENHLRWANFAAGLDRGLTIPEASAAVNRALFDYTPHGQSWFGYQVMRRVFPFWTFRSNNFKLYLDLMRRYPRRMNYLVQILDSAMHYDGDPELRATLPRHLQSRISLHGGNGIFYAGFGLPIEDFAEAMRPLSKDHFLGGIPGSAGLMGQLNPLLATGVEMVADRSFYYDAPIDDLRSGRDFIHAPPWLQRIVGYNPEDERHRIGTLEPGDDPLVPTPEQAARRWYVLRRLDINVIWSQWQRFRAQAWRDAVGDVDPSPLHRVTGGQRLVATTSGIRPYHYDLEQLNERAAMEFIKFLNEQIALTDPQGSWDPNPILTRNTAGANPTILQESATDVLPEMR